MVFDTALNKILTLCKSKKVYKNMIVKVGKISDFIFLGV